MEQKQQQNLKIGVGAVAVVAAYFGIVRPILNDLGITQSADAKAKALALANAGGQGTPFDPKFYDEQNKDITILTDAAADQFATYIYNSMSLIGDNDQAIIAVFKALQTQAQVSFLAYTFFNKYKMDLLSFLKTGSDVFPWNGMSSTDLNTVITLVNDLPNK